MNKMLLAACAFAAVPAAAQMSPAPSPMIPGVTPMPSAPGTTTAPPMPSMPRGMTMQNMTRAQVTDHVRQMFAMLDTNHDGAIDQSEMAAIRQRGGMMMPGNGMMGRMAPQGMPGMRAMPGMPAPGQGDRFGAFDRLDTNHDGLISRGEFANRQALPGAGAPGAQRRVIVIQRNGGAGSLFGMADTNRDGRVTLQEATDLALRHFDSVDRNHDGQITPDERGPGQQRIRVMRMNRSV